MSEYRPTQILLVRDESWTAKVAGHSSDHTISVNAEIKETHTFYFICQNGKYWLFNYYYFFYFLKLLTNLNQIYFLLSRIDYDTYALFCAPLKDLYDYRRLRGCAPSFRRRRSLEWNVTLYHGRQSTRHTDLLPLILSFL